MDKEPYRVSRQWFRATAPGYDLIQRLLHSRSRERDGGIVGGLCNSCISISVSIHQITSPHHRYIPFHLPLNSFRFSLYECSRFIILRRMNCRPCNYGDRNREAFVSVCRDDSCAKRYSMLAKQRQRKAKYKTLWDHIPGEEGVLALANFRREGTHVCSRAFVKLACYPSVTSRREVYLYRGPEFPQRSIGQ